MKKDSVLRRRLPLLTFAIVLPLHVALLGINQCDNGEGDDTDDDGDEWTENEGDCNDDPATGAGVFPGAVEVCDGIDQNCDGQIDEGLLTTYYADRDGDGYGSNTSYATACAQPEGYVTISGDCNDNNDAIYTGAVEFCDTLDNDCDTVIDDGVTTVYYADSDGDGYGNSTSTRDACSQPAGYTTSGGDCNDANATVHPGLTDTCSDELDNDCDGESSEDETVSTDMEPNDTSSTAIDLGTLDNTGTTCKTVSGQILGNTDVDYYKFYSIDQLTDNWSIKGTLTPPSGQTYCVELIDDTSEVMASACSTGTTQAVAEVVYIPELATGYYWLRISSEGGSSCTSYSLTACGF